MKFRKEVNAEPQGDSSRDMRELAEAMSLYRSAMHHVAQKHAAAAAWVSPERLAAESRKHARAHRMRLILVPALGAGLAAAVIAPVALHVHHEKAAVAVVAQPAPAQIVASVDDTELMNQIDSDLTQDVPDALAPLDDLSQQGSTNQSTENRNAHQK